MNRIISLPPLLLLACLFLSGFEQAHAQTYHAAADWKTAEDNLTLDVHVRKKDWLVGETLGPPTLYFANDDKTDVKLIGPTLSVVACTVISPTGEKVDTVLDMPTNLSPERMPVRMLARGQTFSLEAGGLWYLDSAPGKGFTGYRLRDPGQYRVSCSYGPVHSNTEVIAVRDSAQAQAPGPENGFYVVSKSHGRRIVTQDGKPVRLGDRLSDSIDRVVLESRSNDNQRYYLSLEKRDAFSHEYSEIVLCTGGQCLSFDSGGSGDRFTIGTQVSSAAAAEEVAKYFGIHIRKRKHPGHLLSVRFVPRAKSVSLTAAIPVTLEILNLGSTPVVFMPGGKNRGERDNQFGFTAYDGLAAVPDTGSPVHFGGLSSQVKLASGETWRKEVDLRKWFSFKKPGAYEVTGTYEINFVDPDSRDWFVIWQDYATSSFFITTK